MAELVVAVTPGRSAAEYLVDMYKVQTDHEKFYLEDIAMASLDEQGEVELSETTVTTGKGAARGAGIGLLAGFVVGGPIGAAVIGGGIGAIVGKSKEKVISTELMESLQSRLTNGQALVFARALGANAQLAADFATAHGGAEQAFTASISDDTEAELVAAYREANPES